MTFWNDELGQEWETSPVSRITKTTYYLQFTRASLMSSPNSPNTRNLNQREFPVCANAYNGPTYTVSIEGRYFNELVGLFAYVERT